MRGVLLTGHVTESRRAGAGGGQGHTVIVRDLRRLWGAAGRFHQLRMIVGCGYKRLRRIAVRNRLVCLSVDSETALTG